LIDTSLWIAVERGTFGAADIHAITRQEPVYLSPINVAEISFGLHAITRQEPVYLSPINVAEISFGLELLRPGLHKQRAAAGLRRLRRKPQLRLTAETGEVFGQLAAKLRKAGKDPRVRINDLWLAAQAIQRDFGLLTSNAKDFRDIPGLRMVSLQLP
jgi:predicted nucleic acid-binding protein